MMNKKEKLFTKQFLKWIGNKQRFAYKIIENFPKDIKTYREPFLGSAAVLATLKHSNSVGSDSFSPLIGIWKELKENPNNVIRWYENRLLMKEKYGKKEAYNLILDRYNKYPNSADFLYLTRSCYGGVIRFRRDGYMSTPCGSHDPISLKSFSERANEWHKRIEKTDFLNVDYKNAMEKASSGDVIYCDPPYSSSQKILYGGQNFSFNELIEIIQKCKEKNIFVALSHDGTKKSGNKICGVDLPKGLFEKEVMINTGKSMLRRFQKNGETLEDEIVSERLLLTHCL